MAMAADCLNYMEGDSSNGYIMGKGGFELIIGILGLAVSSIWGFHEIRDYMRSKRGANMRRSPGVETLAGLVIFFLLGIAGICAYFFS